ncbi:MFS transporter [Mycobacterium sp. 21AC1]|uniref:MFS transporter n=1 Tax=[Mycobacterium] appelbergii TaxID=2939269 RepID=UPI00293927EF|nr:MFS transporter [Mycobacterium sp. 21AC1]MDV3128368.1 MFS transporter [Mycobacterium sp. 21AC1]
MLTRITRRRPARLRSNPVRQLMAAFVGNAVEWFDWYVYALLAVYFANQFFPSNTDNTLVPLLGTFAVFAVGFFARPLGGLAIGVFADRRGRKAALSATVIGMGAGSLAIAVAPTYEQVGALAPAILVGARLVQGISAGGELSASAAFLVESAPSCRRGLFSSFFYISATTANLAAIGISVLLVSTLSEDAMSTWGWRIPFVLGGLLALAGFWIRSRAAETHLAKDAEKSAQRGDKSGRFRFVRTHRRESLMVFGMIAAPALVYYVWTSFLPTYASITVGLDTTKGLLSSVISLVWFMALQPLFGVLSDRIGRKPLALSFSIAFTFGSVPLLGLLSDSFVSLLLVQMVGLTFIACWSSISLAVVTELFPAEVRAAGVGFPYAVGVALFGGTGPYVATWLADYGDPTMFAWYVAAISLLSLAFFVFMPETGRRPLR